MARQREHSAAVWLWFPSATCPFCLVAQGADFEFGPVHATHARNQDTSDARKHDKGRHHRDGARTVNGNSISVNPHMLAPDRVWVLSWVVLA